MITAEQRATLRDHFRAWPDILAVLDALTEAERRAEAAEKLLREFEFCFADPYGDFQRKQKLRAAVHQFLRPEEATRG